jgi:cytidylate kinase|tara:strand:- start:127 stop:801 length:675 start_codon:yes stop_codon:yes gene_type:complete
MKKYKKTCLQVAIDSPAAAGAGSQAKLISKHYKLLYLDSGKIYRLLAYLKIKNPKKFNYALVSKKMKTLKMSDLQSKRLLSDDVGSMASVIAKDIKIRRLAHNFQMECAYNPSKKYKGSIIDGRDITYNIMPKADLKFFITASAKTRALRRYKELKGLNKKISLNEVLKSIKKRDKSDYNRKVSPLKRTKDQYLISSENESKRSCFLKIKQIIDKKLTLNGNIQ